MTDATPSNRLPVPFYVWRDEDRTRLESTRDLLGWGARFPSGACIVDWNLEAFPPEDRLEHPHLSQYGSVADVEQGTGGTVTWAGPDESDPELVTDGGQDLSMSRPQYDAVRRSILEVAKHRLGARPGCLMCVLVADRHVDLEPRTAYLNDHNAPEFWVDDVVWKCPECAFHIQAGYGIPSDLWHELLDLRGGRRWDAIKSLADADASEARLVALGYVEGDP